MNKPRFLEFLHDYILKMFTGSSIIDEEESSTRDNIVAQGDSGAVKVKFSREDNYRIIIKRAQPFKTFEMHLIRSIIEEMHKINDLNITDDYKKGLKNLIIEKAICKSLTNSSSKTLSALLNEISYWGQRTYEGKPTALGFIVTNKKMGSKTNQSLHISKFLQKDFSALLTDGQNSFMEISADGYVSNYVSYAKTVDYNLFAPYKHLPLATLATGMQSGFKPYYLYRQKNTVGSLDNTGYAKPGKEGLYNIFIMDETHTIFAAGAGAVTKLKAPYSDDIERIYNFKFPTEYLSRYDILKERKEGIKRFYCRNT